MEQQRIGFTQDQQPHCDQQPCRWWLPLAVVMHRVIRPIVGCTVLSYVTLAGVAIVHPVYAQFGNPGVVTGNPLSPPVLPSLTGVPLANVGTADSYMVYVNSSDDWTLSQVRQLEPSAFRRTYNGQSVIQAGVFFSQSNAQQRASQLQSLGMDVQIALMAGRQAAGGGVASFGGGQAAPLLVPGQLPIAANSSPTIPQSVTFNTPDLATATVPTTISTTVSAAIPQTYNPANIGVYPEQTLGQTQSAVQSPQPSFSGYYFVVVPGQGDQLTTIAERFQQLGAQPGSFFPRNQPIGPHVAMGPFPDRGAAEQWNRYLRGYGLDARVYYER